VALSPTTRVKRAYDSAATRKRILDVAAGEFQRHGYHATSMHDIMRAASAAGGSLYHYFPTKKALGLAVIGERVAAEVATTWIAPVRAAPNALEGITAVFDRVASDLGIEGRPILGCPLNNLALELALIDADFHAAVRVIFDSWTDAVGECLRADLDAGRVADIDPEGTATLVVAAFSGAMALAKARQSVEPLRICARELARLSYALRPSLGESRAKAARQTARRVP
jgi:AcrR family transcriptional regulator